MSSGEKKGPSAASPPSSRIRCAFFSGTSPRSIAQIARRKQITEGASERRKFMTKSHWKTVAKVLPYFCAAPVEHPLECQFRCASAGWRSHHLTPRLRPGTARARARWPRTWKKSCSCIIKRASRVRWRRTTQRDPSNRAFAICALVLHCFCPHTATQALVACRAAFCPTLPIPAKISCSFADLGMMMVRGRGTVHDDEYSDRLISSPLDMTIWCWPLPFLSTHLL